MREFLIENCWGMLIFAFVVLIFILIPKNNRTPIPENKKQGQPTVRFIESDQKEFKLPIDKIAIYSNNDELSAKVLTRLRELGYLKGHPDLTAKQFTFTYVYVPAKDHIGSHLQVEMWHPEYNENKMYGETFLKLY